jgi:hypothetical protein
LAYTSTYLRITLGNEGCAASRGASTPWSLDYLNDDEVRARCAFHTENRN